MDDMILDIRADQMVNKYYTIGVQRYMMGQYRIQLCDLRVPDSYAPEGHGSIVQEMCTYRQPMLKSVVQKLRAAEDPLAVARGYAKPWNCEFEGGRIRLDTEPPEGADAES